jgi:hypothetical protein
MVVKRRAVRLIGLVAAATVIALVAGGCARSKPTPIIIVITPRPTATPTATPVPTASPTPTATIVSTPTPQPTLTPPPAAAVSATTCTGTANVKDFWAKASTAMSWDVYCAVLPSGWHASGSPAGGYGEPDDTIWMTYTGPSGERLRVDEGAFCTNGAATCGPGTLVGPTTFGDMLGTLNTLSGGGFAVYVRPGTARGYYLQGTGPSQDAIASFAAAFVKVAKS